MSMRASVVVLAAMVVALTTVVVTTGHAQQGGPPGAASFPDLGGGLKATKGCLGVEMAQTADGKKLIFAWFEDKKAVKRWFYSEVHQQIMDQFFPQGGDDYHKPLEAVADDVPIMAIASITMSDHAHIEATQMPFSQIAIELYTPVNGGIFLGGRFAPEGLKVEGMEDYTPKPD